MAGVATGLDFGAIMAIAHAQDADLALLADTLPDFEIALLTRLNGDADDDSGDDDGKPDGE
jgi:hypothetical protein